MSGTRLDPIVADVRRRADERRTKQPLARLLDIVEPDSRRRERFVTALGKRELAILAECKRRSPSAGVLLAETDDPRAKLPTPKPRPGARWLALAQAYASGGADALSVLTEEDHFAGSLDDLRAVEFTGLSRLRKDFILDEGMLFESCLYGADAILLLPAILDDATLARLAHLSHARYGVAVLIEAHDEAELERALAVEPELVGVNARDLTTLRRSTSRPSSACCRAFLKARSKWPRAASVTSTT